MRALKKLRSSLLMIAILVAVGASIKIASSSPNGWPWESSRPLVEKYKFAPVSRTVLEGSLTAGGRLESSKRTVIECELENITIGIKGQHLAAGGASTLLSVVPDGSVVERGTVLAQIDSSDYEELLRQQRITVERSRADRYQAQLDLEVAKLAISEYREGVMKETLKDYERAIALAQSDEMRCKDRLDWAIRMKAKGYVPQNQVASEKQSYAQALFTVAQETSGRRLFERYTAPKNLRVLDGQVLAGTAVLNYQDSRLQRNLERLAKLEKQVELCTIRAPHDGFVIYANDARRGITIEAGMAVRQKQDLFYLPDLKDMEVVAQLHESIVDQVRKGMKATVRLEGAPAARLSGKVTSISPIPVFDYRSDVRYFDAIVKLDSMSRVDLKPGMTAQVDLYLTPKPNVLTVPIEAVTQEEGQDFCYVAREDRLERRKIELGQATHDLLEIANGLEEGEQVVLNPVLAEVDADVPDETDLSAKPVGSPSGGGEGDREPVNAVAVLH
ncbi:MAG: efflux RND transporter periplasmic adaptor subunit [Paludisphaera borealis]|uniref:efflux RND transporter periplasmic adaptor subunit n=1 Tax=Paludisphaera borealis TaxID=1387353 RepID=UPI00284CD5FF|nr:efflux RND transporter periplasmic adaptor subunit [Paludisphaera borealis]MDR3621843.1 efflux RND transporter periplasmic adaptor subunit [Paludisphaera borealis]